MDECPGCGFEVRAIVGRGASQGNPLAFAYDEDAAPGAADRIEVLAREIASVLRNTDAADLRWRPEPDTWSRVEYACHVRDVLLVQRERVVLARTVDQPEFTSMSRDERVEYDGYADQSPADVAVQVVEAARLFANILRRLDDDAWDRTVVYTWPVREVRTLRWVGVHTAHELVHHLDDMRRQEAVSGA